ncbi:MAG TPA: STAS domain-containing protein [Pseudonocardiaceae bacterium]|jgi:anti-anti-sigma factor|nr:STAS domain-containing protein [Pseudonocardiaceae bacterium]
MMLTRAVTAGDALTITPMAGGRGASLVGDVDLATAPVLEAALNRLLAGDRDGDLHLDLAGLHFVDLSGVAVLVTAAFRLAPERALVVHDPPPALLQIVDRFWGGVARIRMDVS